MSADLSWIYNFALFPVVSFGVVFLLMYAKVSTLFVNLLLTLKSQHLLNKFSGVFFPYSLMCLLFTSLYLIFQVILKEAWEGGVGRNIYIKINHC